MEQPVRTRDSQLSKQDACFACANQVCLTVNHKTSVTSSKWIWFSKRFAWASVLGSCQSYLCHSWGCERLQKSKESLKACFENVNISACTLISWNLHCTLFPANLCIIFSCFWWDVLQDIVLQEFHRSTGHAFLLMSRSIPPNVLQILL